MTRSQRGSATLAAVGFVAVLLLVGTATGVVAAILRAHRMAQSAADLAALAAAGALPGGGDGCGEGARVAVANEATLVACRVDGQEVRLTVRVRGPRWLGQGSDLVAEARAGPG